MAKAPGAHTDYIDELSRCKKERYLALATRELGELKGQLVELSRERESSNAHYT